MKSLVVNLKVLYGKRTYYPVCANAMNIAHIANTKTLTEDTLKRCTALGFKVVVNYEVPTFELENALCEK